MDDDHEPMLETGGDHPTPTKASGRKVVVNSTMEVISEWETGDSDVQSTIFNRYRVDNGDSHGHKKKKKFVTKQKEVRPGGHDWNPALNPGVKNSVKEVKVAMKRMSQATKYETINFIEVGNDIQKAWNFERPPKDYWFDDFWRWLNPCIAALLTAIIGFLVTMLLQLANWAKFGSTRFFFASQNYVAAYFVYVAYCTFYAGISGALVSFLSPAATGGGIPEVKMFLNGIHVPGILSLKTLIAKMIGIVFTIAGGIIAGKEGPFIHAGAIVGGGVGMLGSDWLTRLGRGKLTFTLPRWLGGYHRNPVDHRDFTAIGTAIGIAVAFNSPIGGLLFTVEEGASFYTRSAFWRAFLATGVSCMVVDLIFVLFNEADEVSIFGVMHEQIGMGHMFELMGGYFWRLWELPIFAVVGALGGFAGALLVIVQEHLAIFRHKFIPASKSWRRVFEVMAMAFITANIWYFVVAFSDCVDLPEELVEHSTTPTQQLVNEDLPFNPEGTEMPSLDGSNLNRVKEEGELQEEAERERRLELRPQLNCPDGQFNKFGQLFFTDLSGALRRMVVLGHEVPNAVIYPLEVVGLYYLLAQIMFIWSYGIGCPAGLFVPTLTFGSAFGLFTGHLVKMTFGQWWGVPISFTSYAVIGAAAFLGGTTRMIVSVTVLVAETTGAAGLMVPIMVTTFCAKLCGDAFNHSIYDFAMFTKGAPVLEEAVLQPHQKMIMDKLQASEMMTTRVRALPLRPKLSQVIEMLRSCSHSTIAVTPTPERAEAGEPFELYGVIRRSQLFRLLKFRLGIMTEERRRMHEADITAKSMEGKTGGPVTSLEEGQQGILFANMKSAMIVAAEAKLTNLEILQRLEEVPVKLRPGDQVKILDSFTDIEEEEYIVDLEPFMDRETTVVTSGETLTKTYNLFKTMGHHHVFVIKDRPIVEGLICRKDLLEDIAKLKLGEKANRWKMNVLDEALMLSTIPFLPEQNQQKSSSIAQDLSEAASSTGLSGHV